MNILEALNISVQSKINFQSTNVLCGTFETFELSQNTFLKGKKIQTNRYVVVVSKI